MSFKKISSEIIAENPWWNYRHDRYILADNSQGDYYYCETPGAVMVIPVLDDGRLILVRQFRYLVDKHSIEFACGSMLANEISFETAKRELLEETGFRAGELMKIGEFEPVNGYCKDKTCVYVGVELQQLTSPTQNNNEVLEVLFRRIDEFEQMIRSGEIWDGQSLAAWAIARDYVKNLVNS